MFEQSILVNDRTGRPWSFLASMSAELAVICLVLLIPLARIDRLSGFQWKRGATYVLPTRIEPKPVAVRASATSSQAPVFDHRPFIQSPIRAHEAEPAFTAVSTLDIPGLAGVAISGEPATPLGLMLPKPVIARPPELPPPARTDSPQSGPLRVSSGVQAAKLITKVVPIYPPLARQTRTSGIVHLIGIIARDGTIRNLELVSGNPLLSRAAIDAVRQWVYKPTLLNGEPVEVIAPIDVIFTLSP